MLFANLLFNAGLLLITILFLWAISVRIRDVSFIDSFWAFGMVMLAVATYLHTPYGDPERKLLLLALTSAWGLRLAWHLFTRWRREGEDPRYKRIIGGLMEKKGWSFAKASLLQVFLLQAPLLFVVCLPAQLGQIEPGPEGVGALGWLGATIALVGIAFESIGDAQLKAFRSNTANKGKVLDTGLWRYTRHPNYFGDACTWWGIWLVAAETTLGFWSIIGPVLITFLLMKWSGVPMLERGLSKSRPGYTDYVAKTSAFFPLPPKR